MNDESFILDLLSSCEDDFMVEANCLRLEIVTPHRLYVEHKYAFLIEVYKVFLDLNYQSDHDYFAGILRQRGGINKIFLLNGQNVAINFGQNPCNRRAKLEKGTACSSPDI